MPSTVPFEPWCPFPSASAKDSDPGRNLTGSNGQACFWFSNGCAIGCEKCDGSTRGPIPGFMPNGTGFDQHLAPIPGHIDSGTKRNVSKEPVCGPDAMPATICDPKQRSVNTGAECGSPEDFYYYSPWRAPGYAPVIDSCGTAGGRVPGQGNGAYGASYQNTTNAKDGDLGSVVLKKTPTGVSWKAGEAYEVAWTLQANHGGGYSYRLCPADSTLDEDCFKRTPLDFVGRSQFRWGGAGGHTHDFDAVIVGGKGTNTTSPHGSMWALNPIPRVWRNQLTGEWEGNLDQTGEGFAPFCDMNGTFPAYNQGKGHSCVGMWGPYNLEIVDKVMIPADLTPGDWVLGWRWDCEESNQIWQSCSDVTITA